MTSLRSYQLATATSVTDFYFAIDKQGTTQAVKLPVLDIFKLMVSANDSTPANLENKLLAGANISLTVNNDGANETITIANTYVYTPDYKSKVSADDTTENYLKFKIVAGSNISITPSGAGNETLTIANTYVYTPDYKSKVSIDDTTPDFLKFKIVAGTGITVTPSGAGNETLTIAATGASNWSKASNILTPADTAVTTIKLPSNGNNKTAFIVENTTNGTAAVPAITFNGASSATGEIGLYPASYATAAYQNYFLMRSSKSVLLKTETNSELISFQTFTGTPLYFQNSVGVLNAELRISGNPIIFQNGTFRFYTLNDSSPANNQIYLSAQQTVPTWKNSSGINIPMAQGQVTISSSSTITMTSMDRTIHSTNVGATTVNLVATANYSNRRLTIKGNASTSAINVITITPNGAQTINGVAASITITTANGVVELETNGTSGDWIQIR